MERKQRLTRIFAVLALLIIIIDSRTAYQGAAEGIDLCIRTVIPSLFPFIFLADYIVSANQNKSSWVRKVLSRIFNLPEQASPILIPAIFGGYPVGAACIHKHYKSGCISKEDSEWMIGCFNNPGPAFLFGIVGTLFSSPYAVWVIWFVILLSSVITARFFSTRNTYDPQNVSNTSGHTDVLKHTVSSMSVICGWVILFRILILFLSRWILWLFPERLQLIITGSVELTNGICQLAAITDERFRFIASCGLLAFGGICVAHQTHSVTGNLSMKKYWLTKMLQAILCSLLAAILAGFYWCILPFCFIIIVFSCHTKKNNSRIPASSIV